MANYVCNFFACSFVGTFSDSILFLFTKSSLVVEGAGVPRVLGTLLCPAAALVSHLWIIQVRQDMPSFSVRSAGSLYSSIRFSFFTGKGSQSCRSRSY